MRMIVIVTCVIGLLLLTLTACTPKEIAEADMVNDSSLLLFPLPTNVVAIEVADNHKVYGAYTYPENPADELQAFLTADFSARGLPMEVSDVQYTDGSWTKFAEFTARFTDSGQNACVFSFTMDGDTAPYETYTLDGYDNPSFTIAFKDPDNPQDMIAVLTSVMRYLAPELSAKEAEQLAALQDETLSIDGYSMPLDIGGYQVQSYYTNPHSFFQTEDFTAKLGVTVKALKQIWEKEIDTRECQRLTSISDCKVLDDPRLLLDEDSLYASVSDTVVYDDFVVKDWWENIEPVHGDPTVSIRVESFYGTTHLLSLDPLHVSYKVGVGETYTLFVYYRYGNATILHAVQHNDFFDED